MSVKLCDETSLDTAVIEVEAFLKSSEGMAVLKRLEVVTEPLVINNFTTHADVLWHGSFCEDVPYFGMHCIGSGRPLKAIIADWMVQVRCPVSKFLPALKAGLERLAAKWRDEHGVCR